MSNLFAICFCEILLIAVPTLLEPSECRIAINKGKTFCTSDLEFGDIYGFYLDLPIYKKIALRSGADFYTYDHTFSSWGPLQILVNADVLISDYNVSIGVHGHKEWVKGTVFPYFEIFPGLHIIKEDVRSNGRVYSYLPDNIERYQHSPQLVPGLDMALGVKVSPIRMPIQIYVESELHVIPACNDFVVGYTDDPLVATSSFQVGLATHTSFTN